MGVKWKTTKNEFPKMFANIQALNGKSIEVGAIKGEHSWLAGVHEYGATITAKKAKYLTVPLRYEAAGKSAREIDGLFVYTAKTGNKFLAKRVGESLELWYWLTKSVTIPERSFLRSSHDEKGEDVIKGCEQALGLVVSGKMSVEQYLEMLGTDYITMIKDYITDLDNPPNSPITIENKGSSNPLIGRTNGLIESISFRVK